MRAKDIRTIEESVAGNSKTYGAEVFGRPIEIHFAHVVYTSSATVGTRQLLFQVLNSADQLILDVHAGATQAASLERHYTVMKGIYREGAFIDGSIQIPWPFDLIIMPGWKFKVVEGNNVSSSDTMAIDLQYRILD